jgi:hypothetical protein
MKSYFLKNYNFLSCTLKNIAYSVEIIIFSTGYVKALYKFYNFKDQTDILAKDKIKFKEKWLFNIRLHIV